MLSVFIKTEQGASQFVRLTDAAFFKQCTLDVFTASGPGGQKRNRTRSAVRLTHAPTGLSTVAEESRSQHENRVRALRRLKIKLALRLRTHPDRGWRLPEELLPYFKPAVVRMNARNACYPLYCASMLDLLYLQRGSLSTTARLLGISTGRCAPLFTISKDIMAAANAVRAEFGLGPIRQGR